MVQKTPSRQANSNLQEILSSLKTVGLFATGQSEQTVKHISNNQRDVVGTDSIHFDYHTQFLNIDGFYDEVKINKNYVRIVTKKVYRYDKMWENGCQSTSAALEKIDLKILCDYDKIKFQIK